jgi:hypothetical protein
MTLAASASWTTYGITKVDAFIVVPNALGAVLGTLQLLIYIKFRPATRSIYKDRSSYDTIGAYP